MFSAPEHSTMSLRSRVLVVDDEMGVRESLRAILHGECEVVTASSGQAALDAIARDPVDVMTLDLKMPGLGGIGVLERAKQIDPDLEVLIITGYGSLDTAVQGIPPPAFDYLSKPFASPPGRRLVPRAIPRRAARRAARGRGRGPRGAPRGARGGGRGGRRGKGRRGGGGRWRQTRPATPSRARSCWWRAPPPAASRSRCGTRGRGSIPS